MTFQVHELAKSRSTRVEIRAGEISFDYIAIGQGGDTDDQELYAAVLAGTPAEYGYWQRKSIQNDPLGGGVWNVKVTYGPSEGQMQPGRDANPTSSELPTSPAQPAGSDPLGTEFSFDTTGGTQHITQSRLTVCKVKAGALPKSKTIICECTDGSATVTSVEGPGVFVAADVGLQIAGDLAGIPGGATILSVADDGNSVVVTQDGTTPANCTATNIGFHVTVANNAATTPPDYQQAIGVSHDGVAGCDIVAPKLEFQIVRNFQFCTLNYIARVRKLTGSLNSRKWYGFNAGELLFLGAQGQTAQNGIIRITYRFAASPNETALKISPTLTVPTKGGWDYLWCTYKPAEDTVAKRAVEKADAAYVERVYTLNDFRLLGI